MRDYQLLWGDTHTHFENLESGDEILEDAEANIDFTVVLLYPFSYMGMKRFRVETTRNYPEHLAQWQKINELSRRHYHPGRFTTFPGYEWNGNRTRYGDHNVIYLEEGQPLDDSWDLPDLYAGLKQRQALAIPHHTGYRVGARGKDWRYFDPSISPVLELYSQHGSSEGVDTPDFMAYNPSMGPGDDGGTYRNALEQGLRVGVIGSNDGPGLPGRWGLGRAAVWAAENTRQAIWESLVQQRTYAVTGDRIRLDFRIGDVSMGGETHTRDAVDVSIDVTGSQEIDKIELVQNGRVCAKYAHIGRPTADTGFPKKFKVFLEVGWGPAAHNGFTLPKDSWNWEGNLNIDGGRILGVEKCFSLPGQQAVLQDHQNCQWHLKTAARQTRSQTGIRQGLIFELQSNEHAFLDLTFEGQKLHLPVNSLLSQYHLVPLLDEITRMVEEQFGLSKNAVINPDAYDQNARKLILHRGVPDWDYEISHTFRSISLTPGLNSFYVVVTQTNGQRAWSSPIWVNP